jgi:hypothetical protein
VYSKTSHRWWAVNCKGNDEKTSEKCTKMLLLDYIGAVTESESHEYRFHLVPNCVPFIATCPECNQAREYHSPDLREVEADAPPFGHKPNLEFRKALQPHQEPKLPE